LKGIARSPSNQATTLTCQESTRSKLSGLSPVCTVPTPDQVPLLKRMSIKGYTQNLVIDRNLGRGKPATYDQLPVDGSVELWFADVESLDAAFASDAGRTLITHASEFISEISTFLVEAHVIV